MQMSNDLKIELAKDEIVKSINEVINKYDLPISFTELILSGILTEVSMLKKQKLQQDMEDYKKQQEEKKESDK